MARLAIRATSHTGREVRTVLDNDANVYVYLGNKCTGRVSIITDGAHTVRVAFVDTASIVHPAYVYRTCIVCGDIATCGDFCKKCSDNIPF